MHERVSITDCPCHESEVGPFFFANRYALMSAWCCLRLV
jgi:hypothetical protein